MPNFYHLLPNSNSHPKTKPNNKTHFHQKTRFIFEQTSAISASAFADKSRFIRRERLKSILPDHPRGRYAVRLWQMSNGQYLRRESSRVLKLCKGCGLWSGGSIDLRELEQMHSVGPGIKLVWMCIGYEFSRFVYVYSGILIVWVKCVASIVICLTSEYFWPIYCCFAIFICIMSFSSYSFLSFEGFL